MKSRKDKSHTLIGLAETKVTPERSVLLAGYGDPDRNRRSEGVHDDLFARSIVIERDEQRIAILSVPVVGLGPGITKSLRRAISRQTGIPCNNILVHATHTHSAPCVSGWYRKFLQACCVDCVMLAWKRRLPGRIGVGSTAVSDCGRNRRQLDYGGLPVDPEVGIIRIDSLAGQLRAVLFNYACHGTTLGYHNRLISEDWPHYTIESIKRKKGRNVMGMFLQGTSGDINPGYSAALSAVGADIPTRTWVEAEKIGDRLAAGILTKLGKIRTRSDVSVCSATCYVDLPLRRRFPVTSRQADRLAVQARAALERKTRLRAAGKRHIERAQADVFLAELVCDQAKQFDSRDRTKKTVRAELQTICLADSVITTFPGEVFVETGLELKRRSPVSTMIVELANAYEAGGYLPTRAAFQDGDYEVFGSCYSEDAADTLLASSLAQIERCLQPVSNP